AVRLDSIARIRRVDSLAQAVKNARAARRDSLLRAPPLRGGTPAPAAQPVAPTSPMQGGTPGGPPPGGPPVLEDSAP
ncbi:MAG: hypothetical protein M3Q75_08795, partial [Gemmatimonadota bacterium]|nr:hypothetical protein [Gemmatimonadota bacterium]